MNDPKKTSSGEDNQPRVVSVGLLEVLIRPLSEWLAERSLALVPMPDRTDTYMVVPTPIADVVEEAWKGLNG